MGPPEYWFLGEVPGLAGYDRTLQASRPLLERDPDLLSELGVVYREGRELGLYIFTELQDALIKTLGGSVGLQGQINTIIYVGGDKIGAGRFFGNAVEEPGGRGIAQVKCFGSAPQMARVPLLTNSAVTTLLGATPRRALYPAAVAPVLSPPIAAELARAYRSVQATGSGPEAGGSGLEGAEAAPTDTVRFVPTVPAPEGAEGAEAARAAQVRALLLAGTNVSNIIEQLWGVSGGRAYTKAAAELTAILAGFAAQAGPPPAEGSTSSGETPA